MILISALLFCSLLAGGEPGCSDTEADIAILQMNPTAYFYGWGVYMGLEVVVKNLSPSQSFKGEINLQSFRNIPWDDEYLCGGLEEENYTEQVTLNPGQIKTLNTFYRLCRPGLYPVKVEITTFPSDLIIGNNVNEDIFEHRWEETVDLSIGVDDWNQSYYTEVNHGYASIWFEMYNTGNTPVWLPANQPLAAATLTFPDGITSEVEFASNEATFLVPYPNYYEWGQQFVNFSTFWYLGDEGSYTLSLTLNPNNVVEENNRENNRLELPFGFYVPDMYLENVACEFNTDQNNPGYVIPICNMWIGNSGRGEAYFPAYTTLLEAVMNRPDGTRSYYYSELESYDLYIGRGEIIPIAVELGRIPATNAHEYSVDFLVNGYQEIYERNWDNNSRWYQL